VLVATVRAKPVVGHACQAPFLQPRPVLESLTTKLTFLRISSSQGFCSCSIKSQITTSRRRGKHLLQPGKNHISKMSYFRITLIRSAIGLPAKSTNVLKALGLRKRMATVFHPVSPAVAGQIMKVKELIAVSEVEKPLTKQEVHQERVPEAGFYIETKAKDLHKGQMDMRTPGGHQQTF